MFRDDQRPLYETKANLFKGLAHPYRIRILEILAGSDEASVGTMLADTGLTPSHLSSHLAVLRRYGLVVSDRRASEVFYRLAYPQVAELLQVERTLLGLLVDQSRGAALEELPVLGATGGQSR
ncbi:ArsR/SmtB family transcription factor [Millisia brevis]|uniref:ArsR/SmtB family transcription factor n=1 Tax=Millisia brevis TaxID=264148 RepID=UPI00082F6C49|nr:metalloregulator ArsR/SmtB family transcription factor [Millisia brevis]